MKILQLKPENTAVEAIHMYVLRMFSFCFVCLELFAFTLNAGEYETIFRKEERRGIKVNKLWRNKGHYWKRLNYKGTTRLASFCMEER